jgi:hypothetical protein
MADSYSEWFYVLAFFTFGLILSGFLIAVVSFFLSQREKLGHELIFGILDLLTIALLVIMLAGGYYYLTVIY